MGNTIILPVREKCHFNIRRKQKTGQSISRIGDISKMKYQKHFDINKSYNVNFS